jgi:hypothetical protein
VRIAKEAVLEEEKQDALRTRREAQEATMERYEKEDDSLFADVYDITKKFPDVDTGTLNTNAGRWEAWVDGGWGRGVRKGRRGR